MNARQIILEDCLHLSKGEPSSLAHIKYEVQCLKLIENCRFISLASLLPMGYLAFTKRHTGRKIYLGGFFFLFASSIMFSGASTQQLNNVTKLVGESEDNASFRRKVNFYRYAALDR